MTNVEVTSMKEIETLTGDEAKAMLAELLAQNKIDMSELAKKYIEERQDRVHQMSVRNRYDLKNELRQEYKALFDHFVKFSKTMDALERFLTSY